MSNNYFWEKEIDSEESELQSETEIIKDDNENANQQKSFRELDEINKIYETYCLQYDVLFNRVSIYETINFVSNDKSIKMELSKLRYDCAGLHEYCTRTLFRLDSIESYNNEEIRKNRKKIVVKVNKLADKSELLLKRVNQLIDELNDFYKRQESIKYIKKIKNKNICTCHLQRGCCIYCYLNK